MGKRKPKREAVRVITGGKPHHEERTFDPYPVRCEVEPLKIAEPEEENDGPDGYGDPF